MLTRRCKHGITEATRTAHGPLSNYGKSGYGNRRGTLVLLDFFIIVLFLCSFFSLPAQTNLVPNGSFEDVTDCDLEYGDADKAVPWQIINLPVASPDLFHACSESTFYDLPVEGCPEFLPLDGDGMVGMVHLQTTAEERIYARLTDTLPHDIDIYVSFATRPRAICEPGTGTLCYSNTPSLAFCDFGLIAEEYVILEPAGILDDPSQWTRLETCYRAIGNNFEETVLLGNFRPFSQTQSYCPVIDDQNFAYYYIDDVIVAPFDVVPDTLYLCQGETLDMDATFYEVPIFWDDGFQGPTRTIDQGGNYIVRGLAGNCFLTDSVYVVEIPFGTEVFELDLCAGESVTLSSPFAGVWENGDTNRVRTVTRAGLYESTLQTPCGERARSYTITTTDCEIRYFVPNAFSPNRDGVNDRLPFFFAADFDFTGTLQVFDRWGNQLFRADNVGPLAPVTWDGTFRGRPLGAGIVVWTYAYVSARDGITRTVAGDVMMVK